MLDLIYEIAKKKSWLREECGWILYGTSETLKDGHHDICFAQAIIDKLYQNTMAKTSEGIAIWLKLQADFPEVQFPAGVWPDDNPLHRKKISKLAEILKEASPATDIDEASVTVLQKGNWTSKTPFVWNVIFAKLANDDFVNGSTTKSKTISFGEFWRQAVDGMLRNELIFYNWLTEARKSFRFVFFRGTEVLGICPFPAAVP